MRIETRAIHAGRRIDPATGAVTLPIHLSTTFERSPDGQYPLGFSYSRENNPNRAALETCLAEIEGGTEALVFSSGLAVTTALVQGLEPGDHLLAPDDVYWGLRKVIGGVFGKWGLETSYVDMTQPDAVRAALRPSTRLIWIETPSNPLMKITSLAAIAQLARDAGPTSSRSATAPSPRRSSSTRSIAASTWWPTPPPSTSAATAMWWVAPSSPATPITCSSAPAPRSATAARSRRRSIAGSRCAASIRCPTACRADSENAQRVAEFLAGHAAVETVHYPGLPSHPGHAVAASQMSAFGGMLSFQVRGTAETAMAVAARCRLFIRATSLGGAHSLIEHRASVEGPQTRTPENLLRLSVGLEHPDDLIDDLSQALAD